MASSKHVMDYVLSNVLIKGLGSNAGWAAGPDRRFAGVAPSASSSMKSRVMKSLVEKSSSEKLGPWGNKALEPDPDSALSLALNAIVVAGPRGTQLVCGKALNSSTIADRPTLDIGTSRLGSVINNRIGPRSMCWEWLC